MERDGNALETVGKALETVGNHWKIIGIYMEKSLEKTLVITVKTLQTDWQFY